jgi:Flp pilus assembly protein TadD
MRRTVLASLALALATLAAYAPIAGHGFVCYDDRDYLYGNAQVREGLSLANVAWAFTTGTNSNWHPLTWLSHMLDVELFGIDRPGMHHLHGLLLHAASAVLLLIVFARMTGAFWRSAFVAAVFALHPLHVESVAWASERKDVLSTLLGFCCIGAHAEFARTGARRWYLLSLGALALGLMAKPMLVTLPFLLLVLDGWPLQRLTRASLGQRVREKVPMLALVAGSAVVTYLVQDAGGAVKDQPLAHRLATAATAYVRYLGKTLLPTDLAVLYPNRLGMWSAGAVAGALGALLAISAAVAALRRVRYLPTGWLWYLGTLVPVIGLVQVGDHSMADRYTYLPQTGIAIALTWGAVDLARRARIGAGALAAAGGTLALAMALATRAQVAHWKDSVALFSHALQVAEPKEKLHKQLGFALAEAGRIPDALEQYRLALALDPSYARARAEYGFLLLQTGVLADAQRELEAAVALEPRDANAFSNLGMVRHHQGDHAGAVESLSRALELEPAHAQAKRNLAVTRVAIAAAASAAGECAAARANAQDALRLQPDWPPALRALAWALATCADGAQRDPARAIELGEQAARLTQRRDAAVLDALAAAYASAGRFELAVQAAREALAIAEGMRAVQAADVRARLALYSRGEPYREPGKPK